MRGFASVSALGILWLGLLATAAMGIRVAGYSNDRYAMVGAQGWGEHILPAVSATTPRINILEVDTWRRSLANGALRPVARVPFSPSQLIGPDDFSPEFYRQQIQALDHTYTRQRDVLMYYGGPAKSSSRHGLNFNAWSLDDLRRLREGGSRPFIGLETMDRRAVTWMAERLHDAGYGPLNRVYVRIGAEPSGTAYGSEDGTAQGRRHTPAAFAAYQRRFAEVSSRLVAMNFRYGLDIRTVFAGTTGEDFNRYCPPSIYFDDLGYDLYVTPQNKEKTFQLIRDIQRRFPEKILVLPELGVATAGPGASPRWAQKTLGELLMLLARHPAGVGEVTVFSVNVARRLPKKRWNWAWTPLMFEMLKEWESRPRRWRQEGFHRYDPLSYPEGRDVLYLNRSDLRIVYRKLSEPRGGGLVWFHEVRLFFREGRWQPRTRLVAFSENLP